jgi:catechol 2,3-dioxygenase-like lactoylglutathione lyase family enzyme
MRASPPGALTRLMRNMRTLPQYAALVNPVLPVCHVTDLRKQHGRGVSEQVESCLDCLDMGTAVLLAGLTRALVATALAEARQGTPPPAAPARWVGGGPGRCGPVWARRARRGPVHRPARRCAQPAVAPARPRPGRAQRVYSTYVTDPDGHLFEIAWTSSQQNRGGISDHAPRAGPAQPSRPGCIATVLQRGRSRWRRRGPPVRRSPRRRHQGRQLVRRNPLMAAMESSCIVIV